MKTVLITGAASALGMAVAERLVLDGWRVVLADRDVSALAPICETLGRERALALTLDVTKLEDVKAAIEHLPAPFDVLHGLVNYPSDRFGADIGAFSLLGADAWTGIVDRNLRGFLNCCYAVIPRLIATGGGGIVSVSNFEALRGSAASAVFSAASAGSLVFVETMVRECQPHNIRINTIIPPPPDSLAQRPNEQWPATTADSIAYLLSDRAIATTGACLDATAGWALH